MAANPRITKLGRELIALYIAQEVTCEESARRKSCNRIPEYRCELGPFPENIGTEGFVNVTKDLCTVHARAFASLFQLRLPGIAIPPKKQNRLKPGLRGPMAEQHNSTFHEA